MTAEVHPTGTEIAARAVAMALDAGATQAEALVIESGSALTRFANNEIHQNVSEQDTVVNLRFVEGQRSGVASANRPDEAALRRLAASAATICRLQPELPGTVSLPGPAPTPLVAGAFAQRTAEADPDARADAAGVIIAAASTSATSTAMRSA